MESIETKTYSKGYNPTKKREYYLKHKKHILDYRKKYTKTPQYQIVKKRFLSSKKGKELIRYHSNKRYQKIKNNLLIKQKELYLNPNFSFQKHIQRYTALTYQKYKICQLCKVNAKTDFHHFHYKPNIFIEVCRPCHSKIHYESKVVKYGKY